MRNPGWRSLNMFEYRQDQSIANNQMTRIKRIICPLYLFVFLRGEKEDYFCRILKFNMNSITELVDFIIPGALCCKTNRSKKIDYNKATVANSNGRIVQLFT